MISNRLIAYAGSYPDSPNAGGGGITVVEVSDDGRSLVPIDHAAQPALAGHLAYAPRRGIVYCVDERKTDGRGPVEPPAALHALRCDPATGRLCWLNACIAPGPRPTYVSVDEETGLLATANHGDFDHVERVVRSEDGTWTVEHRYDDSTVVRYDIAADGSIGGVLDVHVRVGHGPDPNSSRQAGGHAQASPHAHCATIDPTGRYLVVCDKGTDEIVTFGAAGTTLDVIATSPMPTSTGPRHLAFDPRSGLAYATFEFSSELATLRFDPSSGAFTILGRVATTHAEYVGLNEPAEVRVHPTLPFVYVNNRGEDSLAWFQVGADGTLARVGAVPLAASVHPGLAARSFTFDPSGRFVLVADRPANRVVSYAVDPSDGSLSPIADVEVVNAAYVLIVELPHPPPHLEINNDGS